METNLNRPVAIVLGGTNPHRALIENLKKRGYCSVLVDFYENPPAKSVADKHIKESTLDKGKVLDIAIQYSAKLVISACVDQANVTACYVAEKMGLPAPYSYLTSLEVTNKPLMKSKMVANGIPTPKHIVVNRLPDRSVLDGLTYPVIVKPADSNSSKGVKRADHFNELKTNSKLALGISRTGDIVIEEYLDGMEIDVVGFLGREDINILMVRHRIKVNGIDGAEMQYYRSIIPATITDVVMSKIKDILSKISASFNLRNTPIQVQAIITGDNVSVIEFAPRVGGGLSYRTVKMSTGFDILDSTIDSYLGKEPPLQEIRAISCFFSEVNLYAEKGFFDRVIGFNEIKAKGLIEEYYVYKSKRASIGEELSSNNRIGSFILKANSLNELFEKYWSAINSIDIVDSSGMSIFRKDLYKDPRTAIFQCNS